MYVDMRLVASKFCCGQLGNLISYIGISTTETVRTAGLSTGGFSRPISIYLDFLRSPSGVQVIPFDGLEACPCGPTSATLRLPHRQVTA